MAFCPNCGTQLQDGSSFCPSCGKALGSSPAAAPSGFQPQAHGNGYQTPQPNYGYQNQQPNYGYQNQQPAYGYQSQQPGYGSPVQTSAAVKSGKKKIWIIVAAAVLVIGLAVFGVLLLTGSKTELTMEQFVDKYIEVYKAHGSYDNYVDGSDEEFRQEILEDVQELGGDTDSEGSYFGASSGVYVRIRRKGDPNVRMYFLLYPDEATAEAAISKFRETLDKESKGGEGVVKSEGRNSQSLTYPLTEKNDTYVRVVQVGKTIMVASCSEDAIVNTVLEGFGY